MSVPTQQSTPPDPAARDRSGRRVRTAVRDGAAVLGGLVTIVVLSNGTDVVLESTGMFPTVADQQRNGFTTGWMLLLALAYRTVSVVVGAAVTARLAGRHPRRGLITLAAVGVALGAAGAAAQDVTPL